MVGYGDVAGRIFATTTATAYWPPVSWIKSPGSKMELPREFQVRNGSGEVPV